MKILSFFIIACIVVLLLYLRLNKRKVSDVYHYLLGNLRYWLYYSPYKGFIRPHVLEQIEYRIKVMDKDCYEQGYCKLCGCSTTALQMSNKACDKPCYPKMMSKKQWNKYVEENGN